MLLESGENNCRELKNFKFLVFSPNFCLEVHICCHEETVTSTGIVRIRHNLNSLKLLDLITPVSQRSIESVVNFISNRSFCPIASSLGKKKTSKHFGHYETKLQKTCLSYSFVIDLNPGVPTYSPGKLVLGELTFGRSDRSSFHPFTLF